MTLSSGKSQVEYPSDREMVFTRIFDAPRELVWEAYTDPRQVVQWWGPKGFTNTFYEMDVRPGGLWRLTMHGPDGVNYPNRIEFIEVSKPARLVYHHGDEVNPHMFHVTTNFIAEGPRTKIVSHMRFRTAAECAATKGHAVDGHSSTMDRLGEQLAKMEAGARTITITRVLAAPRQSVFNAFADPARLAQWWGPKNFTNTIHIFELRPGGRWDYTMHGPDGIDYANQCVFTEIAAPGRIVFQHLEPIHRFLMTMLFAEQDGQTTLTWQMRFESAAECARVKAFILPANEENFDRLMAQLAASV